MDDNNIATIIGAIKGTPWWVYIIFIYLLWVGLSAIKRQSVPLPRFFILPIVLTILQFSALLSEGKLYYFIEYLIFLGIGGAIGWCVASRIPIQIDKLKKSIVVPGTWWTLILVMAIFAIKYTFGYMA